jgi:hypothetical protein
MNPLKFNRELARKRYLSQYPVLKNAPRKLDLLVMRGELLTKNVLFCADWRKLELLSESKNKLMLDAARKEFALKWNIHFPSGLTLYPLPWPHPVVQIENASRDEARITISIDIRYPKKKILQEIEAEIDKWAGYYQEDIEEGIISNPSKPNVLKRNTHADLVDWDRNLKVWDLRKQNKSWDQIAKELKLNNLQAARNHFKAAERLIKEGLPGFPPFPTS